MGLAADWVVAPQNRGDFMQTARMLGLIPVDEGSHIHVQRYEAGLLPAYLFPAE
jgi:hypothetical protein